VIPVRYELNYIYYVEELQPLKGQKSSHIPVQIHAFLTACHNIGGGGGFEKKRNIII
jgi:hypothetical protein